MKKQILSRILDMISRGVVKSMSSALDLLADFQLLLIAYSSIIRVSVPFIFQDFFSVSFAYRLRIVSVMFVSFALRYVMFPYRRKHNVTALT